MTMTSAQTSSETLGFQAEVKQLLHLMIHSLYSRKEIFLRELISNASDAIEKLRFQALTDSHIQETLNTHEPRVRVTVDEENHTIEISDNGIGMTREEVIEHLGTIAKSGTAAFLEQMGADKKSETQLIGQFGVGFYSAYLVAQRVEVYTRKAGTPASAGVHWESTGEGEFTIAPISKAEVGTRVVLHLRDDAKEFASAIRLRTIVKKYSDHISVPVEMLKLDYGLPDDEEETDQKDKESANTEPEFEVINQAQALWTLPRNEISDEQYREFYQHIAHDFEDPLTWSHNKVEGKAEYTSLLYVPKRAPFDLYNRDAPKGLKLYVQRVFILDNAEQFLPLYLRFIKGVIDSNDLPLNVSREVLQSNPKVESMKTALTKRALSMLKKIADNEAETYQTVWGAFGEVLKEGPAEDMANREEIASLMRFATTRGDGAKQIVSLDQYIERMVKGQEHIYYITAQNYQAAINSPHLEVFKKKGVEVVLLTDRIDEWMMTYLSDYKGKHLRHVAKGALSLDSLGDDAVDKTDQERKAEEEKLAEDNKELLGRFKEALKDRVDSVRVSHRLTDSPACWVMNEYDMGDQMRQIMRAAGQFVPETKPILELNPTHPLIERIAREVQEDRFVEWAQLVFDQAALAEGKTPSDPAAFVRRINRMLLELLN